jgi:hypothetical protein
MNLSVPRFRSVTESPTIWQGRSYERRERFADRSIRYIWQALERRQIFAGFPRVVWVRVVSFPTRAGMADSHSSFAVRLAGNYKRRVEFEFPGPV